MLHRVVARVLKLIHDRRPLPPASDAERAALAELRATFAAMPESSTDNVLPSERSWLANMNRLRQLVLTRDPRSFLRWDVVVRTMFVSYAGYTRSELRYLQSREDWTSRWRPAVREDRVGSPMPYLFHRESSANLIHHAYHLAQFEARCGMRVSEMDYIVEFGGGYGSMCRLAHRLGFAGKYIIFDLPAFSALQRYFIRSVELPLLSGNACFSASRGVCCVSDVETFQALCAEASTRGRSPMFIATWSLSEAPVSLRETVIKAVGGFKAFLIGYQDRFGEVDNLAEFESLRRTTPGIGWQDVPFEPSAGNRYLVGTTR